MATLVLIGLLGGLVTGISPCILPVLPVVLVAGAAGPGGAAGGPDPVDAATATPSGAGPGGPAVPAGAVLPRRDTRPLAIVVGLVLSFSLATLLGSWVLGLLGLPQDALRWLGLVAIGLLGVGLAVPVVGHVLERPFAHWARGAGPAGGSGRPVGGLVLGLSLGLVFVPCAGPVLAALAVVGADHRFGAGAVALTVAFAVGVAVPLLLFALLGRRLVERAGRLRRLRSGAVTLRRVAGVVLVLTAAVVGANLTDGLQQAVPGYTDVLQTHLEASASARRALGGVTGQQVSGSLPSCPEASPVLQQCGPAPSLAGADGWLDTPGDRPLALSELRGRVVLVDFWTYSCINCQRSLPHVEAWSRAYGPAGLTVIGVHTPEFAFEHVASNVRRAAAQLGVDYPIAIDDHYRVWNAYDNQYWPAEYLVDGSGEVRHVDFGEGGYGQTETLIRRLLVLAHPGVRLPPRTDVPDRTPTEQTTPETYLGYQRLEGLAGAAPDEDHTSQYRLPASIPADTYAYGGTWKITAESSDAGPGAVLALDYQAKDVYLVLGGTGTVGVAVDGKPTRSVAVDGEPRLYQLVGPGRYGEGALTLTLSPGLRAYDFTFG